jgi:hypothetical protein
MPYQNAVCLLLEPTIQDVISGKLQEVAVVEVLAAVKRCAHHGRMSFQQAQIDINYDGYVIRAVLRDYESGYKKKKEMYQQNLRM